MSWWETQPLFGRKVLVTRAKDQCEEIAAALRAVGAAPVVRPMIELAPVEDAAERQAVDAALDRLEDYDALVFSSSNAVRFFTRALAVRRDEDMRLAPGTRTFCIGEATAEAALAAGLPVHVVASGRSDAEALLGQLLQALPGQGERVLIPRSRIGRTTIADGLRDAGSEVDSIAFYTNTRPEIDTTGLRELLVRGELAALTFTSPSTADHFVEALDEESRAAAGRCIIAAIGRTTARHLESLGLAADFVPERPDVGELVAGLVRLARDRGRSEGGARVEPDGDSNPGPSGEGR